MPIITTIFPFLPRELKRPQATSQKTNTFKARSQTLCSQNRVFSVHEVSTSRLPGFTKLSFKTIFSRTKTSGRSTANRRQDVRPRE